MNASLGQLPAHASLENLRKRAKSLVKQHRDGDAEAASRVQALLPQATLPLHLHDAQFVIARENGFASWPRLVNSMIGEKPANRVHRQGGRVWLDGVPRLRWGASPEPTYLGALEAAFRGSERPLDLTTLMGDSALCFRVRWATRDQGQAWCGSGPCGEWPDEVAALNNATGYVFEWECAVPGQPHAPHRVQRMKDHIDNGWPVLALGSRMDLSVIHGYEDDGQRVLLSDYWADADPYIIPTSDVKEISAFMLRIDPPLPRADAVRAGVALAVKRWRQGVVEADPITGATYHYGSEGYRRWIADLARFDTLSDAQRGNLFFLNGWTYSSLAMNHGGHAAKYLREGAHALGEGTPASQALLEAAAVYDQVAARIGRWDPADPAFGFVKQKGIETWTPEVRAKETALLRDLLEMEEAAMRHLEHSLA
ncbi:hypothetical protein [Piscinibacter terrae]|uniref:hypothetical protein n=1 Tax=Piscinibacter terrae TaxID=2496871 RepID=UPI000F5968F3|nr:hypothetical protein [Albitalea terrae]